MHTDPLLFQIIWIVFIIIWLSSIINKKIIKQISKEVRDNNITLYLSGIIELIIGLYVVLTSFYFTSIPEIIVSIIWLMLTLEWFLVIVFPRCMKGMSKKTKKCMKYSWVFWILYILIGWYLTATWFGVL